MIKKSEKKILFLTASSPDGLDRRIKGLYKEETGKGLPVVLAIDGPKVLVNPFHLEDVPLKEVIHHLKNEAVEVISLTSGDIELDYKVTFQDEHNIKGIYACAPRKTIEEYLKVLEGYKFNPVVITQQFLVCVSALEKENQVGQGRVGFLSFLPEKRINLFVANGQECELIREIPYEDFQDAEREIVQSLRSACAKSWPKDYNVIYYAGAFEDIDAVKKAVKKFFKIDLTECSISKDPAFLAQDTGGYSLNFLKSRAFSPLQRQYIKTAVNLVFGLCLIHTAVLGAQAFFKAKTVEKIKMTYTKAEYKHAVELKKELEQ